MLYVVCFNDRQPQGLPFTWERSFDTNGEFYTFFAQEQYQGESEECSNPKNI